MLIVACDPLMPKPLPYLGETMHNEVSVIIPVGPRHERISKRAVASVEAQSIRCFPIVVNDLNGRGPGWARNRGIELAGTSFVIFLDADDQLMPTFAEQCLKAWKPDHYVYTDWYQPNEERISTHTHAPEACQVWRFNEYFHLITALVPTDAARDTMFDESIKIGGEDRAFWYALTRGGCCPIAVHEPLCMYEFGGKGRRSAKLRADTDELVRQRKLIKEKYGGIEMTCSSCSNEPIADTKIKNHDKPGEFTFDRTDGPYLMKLDTFVEVINPNRNAKIGRGTGYKYPRIGPRDRLYVDSRDARSMPSVFRVIAPESIPELRSLPTQTKQQQNREQHRNPQNAMLNNALGGGVRASLIPASAIPAATQPDYNKVIDLMQGALA